MQHPPEWFVRGLELFDSGLHVRWGNAVGRWVVEREGFVTEQEVYFLTRRSRRAERIARENPNDADKVAFAAAIAEEVISANAKRRVILYAKTLTHQVFETLMLRDIQRFGGYARAIVEMENAEIKANEEIERQQANHSEGLHKELYDQLQFVERKKQNELAAGYSWRDLLESGRSSENSTKLGDFTVVDKRAVPHEVTI